MNVVMIIPTGIGCKIGGHAGDANPVAKLLGSVCDNLILHPNVVNASDINEMPENAWYVEGSLLDRFLEGKIKLEKPRSNKILLAVNKPIRPETINAVSAARHTIGCEVEIVELDSELKMIGKYDHNGCAGGEVFGVEALVEQIEKYHFDALCIATQISVPKEVALKYLRKGGVNPWGGIEAITSKAIANRINKPVAHAPVETDDVELSTFKEAVNPREAAEVVSNCYVHCVFKGLHKAPRVSNKGLSVEDVDCLITPTGCVGRPHRACLKAGIPIIAVKENMTCLNDKMPDEFILVENYLEAVGMIILLKTGMTITSVTTK